MDMLKKTVKDIKSVKVQGATNVTKAAVSAFEHVSKTSKAKAKAKFVSELETAKNILYATRATEPQMRNSIRFIFQNVKDSNVNDVDDLRKLVSVAAQDVLKNIKSSKEKIASIAGSKIEDNMTIFTHCHSSTVINAFKNAKQQGRKFSVICTETRPLYQGRRTAKDLIELGIPATMIVDSNVSAYIKNADMVMVGADLITADESFLNKVGTQNVAYAAKRVNIPFYVCADLTKFDSETIFGKPEAVEQRSQDEVWKNRPKKLKIINPAFDVVPRELVTAFITQEGLVVPGSVQDTIKDKFSWLLHGLSPKLI